MQPDDPDGDGWADDEDLCPLDYDPGNGDANTDGIGDVCQDAVAGPDTDGARSPTAPHAAIEGVE